MGVSQRTYAETFTTWYWDVVMPNRNAENLYTVGAFTMPFDGKARVDLFGAFDWVGNQSINLSMAAQSTPTPTETSDLMVMDTPPGAFRQGQHIASHARWDVLTAGQVVTMVFRVYVGGGVDQPKLKSTAAVIRMFRH